MQLDFRNVFQGLIPHADDNLSVADFLPDVQPSIIDASNISSSYELPTAIFLQ